MMVVNTIMGAGFLLNIYPLMNTAGILGFLGYLGAFLALLPIMLVVGKFAEERPMSGGMYQYPKEFLSPALGFLSGWSYFLGKSATVALLTHALSLFFIQQGLFSATYSALTYDIGIILLLGAMNSLGVSIGGRIQLLFTALKMIPFSAVLIGGIYFLIKNGIPKTIVIPPTISLPTLLPLALFAFSGFEIICAIGHQIENLKENGLKIILSATAIVLALYSLLQTSVAIVLNSNCPSNVNALLPFSKITFGSEVLGQIIINAAYLAILSGIFANLANNSWNFHALAKDNFFPAAGFLTQVNAQNVPWVALIIKIVLIISLLLLTQQQSALQNISVACVTVSYLLIALAAFFGKLTKKINQVHLLISAFGIISCIGILFFCYLNITKLGLSLPFITIYLCGLIIASVYKIIIL
jgi:APA family basic amino acid/polyamine antiporter